MKNFQILKKIENSQKKFLNSKKMGKIVIPI